VLKHYHKLHKGILLTQKHPRSEELSLGESISFAETVEIYRTRLYDISWFMRDLNKYIAREANKEDDCTAKLWEGRLKSQALLGERPVLSCMAYVDLNVIRAKREKTLEASAQPISKNGYRR
jgi:hypothetical protein